MVFDSLIYVLTLVKGGKELSLGDLLKVLKLVMIGEYERRSLDLGLGNELLWFRSSLITCEAKEQAW